MRLRWCWMMPAWFNVVWSKGSRRGTRLHSLLLVSITRIPTAGRRTGALHRCSDGGAAATSAVTTWAVPWMRGNFGVGFQDGKVFLVLSTLTGWSFRLWSSSLWDYRLEEDYLGLLYNFNSWSEAPWLHRGGVITRLSINKYIQNQMRPKHYGLWWILWNWVSYLEKMQACIKMAGDRYTSSIISLLLLILSHIKLAFIYTEILHILNVWITMIYWHLQSKHDTNTAS